MVLRRLRADDLATFHSYRSDPVVGRYQGWKLMSEREALAFIAAAASTPLFVAGEWAQVAIASADSDSLLGDLGLFVSEHDEFAEVGFTLHPRFGGSGYATAAVREAIRLIFERTQVHRVVGVTDARNLPSIRVLERVGMTCTDSRETLFKGEPCVELIYAISR